MFGRKTRGVLNYKLKRFPNTLSFLLPVCWNLSSNTEHFVLGNCEFMQIVRMILLSTLKYVEYFTTSGISITRSYTYELWSLRTRVQNDEKNKSNI